MGHIRKEELHESLINELEELGNIDLSGKQDKTDESLLTESKDLVGAINELFQSANNGKELIANAIGEPLSSNDTFSAMSNDINGLLSIFKTNMMNNGITVESGDKFKSLIDKIATLADNEGKGVQFASGVKNSGQKVVLGQGTAGSSTVVSKYLAKLIINDIKFKPDFIIAYSSTWGHVICYFNNKFYTVATKLSEPGSEINTSDLFFVNDNTISMPVIARYSSNEPSYSFEYYMFGVGEEDTTLRDSLASILTDEGVNVTEEDDMASLITKVDEEFTKDNTTINDLNTDKTNLTNQVNSLNTEKTTLTNQVNSLNSNIENTRNTLTRLMQEGGYDITGDESIDSLLDLLILSGISVIDIKQIACGENHTFILKNDGSLWGCGYNQYGQLGLGNTTTSIYTFTQVTTNINNDVKQIACGGNHTFILKNDGSVYSCGNNNYGNLGLGTTDNSAHSTFTKVTTNINNDVKQIACGVEFTFIVKNDGSVWSCGRNNYGSLGLGDTALRSTFTQVTTNINNDVKQICCGVYHTFILKNDGSVWSCGNNINGELGLGDNNYRFTFTQVTNDVRQIACGYQHTFILKNNGSLWSCGEGGNGRLGLGDGNDRNTFTQVTTNINNDVKQIVCGGNHTFILKNDGSVWSCGYNANGELGLGDKTNRTTFTQVTTNINNDIKQIVCGYRHTFILKNDGSVWSCGLNNNGPLGLGDTNIRTTFTVVPKGFSY